MGRHEQEEWLALRRPGPARGRKARRSPRRSATGIAQGSESGSTRDAALRTLNGGLQRAAARRYRTGFNVAPKVMTESNGLRSLLTLAEAAQASLGIRLAGAGRLRQRPPPPRSEQRTDLRRSSARSQLLQVPPHRVLVPVSNESWTTANLFRTVHRQLSTPADQTHAASCQDQQLGSPHSDTAAQKHVVGTRRSDSKSCGSCRLTATITSTFGCSGSCCSTARGGSAPACM